MNRKGIITKTAKGMREASGVTHFLARDQKALIKAVDGKSTLDDLAERLGQPVESGFGETLERLAAEGYIQEALITPLGVSDERDLDFTRSGNSLDRQREVEADARRKGEETARRWAVERARRRTEEHARRDAEERAAREAQEQARLDAEKAARKEAEAQAKRAAEERIRREAEEQARRDAAHARREAEVQARREAEERAARKARDQVRHAVEEAARKRATAQAKRDAEERARREAEEQARREAQEQAAREAEERVRREAEAQAKREAEEQARREAEAQVRRQAEERARREAEEREAQEAAERARSAAAEAARIAAKELARREAEEQARREAIEEARREAEEQGRREAEEREAQEAAERARTAAAEAQARREAEEQAAREAEERVRREVEAQAKREAEERARREAEEREAQEAEERARSAAAEAARMAAEEQARLEAEEQAAREAEEQAAREAEERVRREAEVQAKREAEEQSRREAEEETRREAEEQARREAEEAALRAAREHVRRAAEAHARKDADDRTWHEVEEPVRREAEDLALRGAEEAPGIEDAAPAPQAPPIRVTREQKAREAAERRAARKARRKARKAEVVAAAAPVAPVVYRRPVRWGRPLAFSFLALVAGGLALLHLMSFDGQIVRFEKIAAERFQQPVRIRAVHLSLLLQPHWILEGVTVGNAGQIRAPRIRASSELGALLRDEAVFPAIEIDAPVLTEEGLGWLLLGKAHGRGVGAVRIEAHGAVLRSKNLSLPPFDASAEIGEDGNWRAMRVGFSGTDLTIDLAPAADAIKFSLQSTVFSPTFLAGLPALTGFSAEGTAGRSELRVTQFEGRTHDGSVSGSARLRFGGEMALEGEMSAKRIDMATLMPGLFEGGQLDGAASFVLPVHDAGKPAAPPRLAGSFVVQRGVLAGIDMGSVLKSTGRGGRTRFARLDGTLVIENGRTQLRQLQLDAGAMSARGNVDVAADRTLRGRVDVDLSAATTRRHAVLDLSGAFMEPYLKNADWTRR